MGDPNEKKTKVGTITPDEKPSLVGGACALGRMLDDVISDTGESPVIRNLLGSAAQNTITEGVSSDQEPGSEKKVVTTEESVTPCAQSFAHHAKLMDSAMWSGLPEELQELVFARLPWPQIYQVRILSKGWNEKLMSRTKDSELKRTCFRAQPKSIALLATDDLGSSKINKFDMASSRWRTFETSPGFYSKRDSQGRQFVGGSATDGGLVCLLTKATYEPMTMPWHVSVCNPLTRVCKQLPPLHGIVQSLIMVQLIMDQETKQYRVVVVGHCEDPKVGNLVQVYHSQTGNWTQGTDSSSREVVYGYLYNFYSLSFQPFLCSFNFADGQVYVNKFPEHGSHESDLVKDHLFRLTDEIRAGVRLWTHCIGEYEAVDCGSSWLPLKQYPLNRLPRTARPIQPVDVRCWMHLFACNDFLLLFEVLVNGNPEDRCEFLWLYKFSEEEWRELPMMPEFNRLICVPHEVCELRFDSVP